jgi:mitogen-activated protein kinase organizer 1
VDRYTGHENRSFRITSLFAQNDAFVASGSEDGSIVVWDLVDVRPDPELHTVGTKLTIVQARIVHRLKGHTKVVCGLSFHERDGGMLLSAGGDGAVRVWKTK